MGCIVNGLGEAGDADYSFVGEGKGRISLYKGINITGEKLPLLVRRVPQQEALVALVDVIKEGGNWKEPPEGWIMPQMPTDIKPRLNFVT